MENSNKRYTLMMENPDYRKSQGEKHLLSRFQQNPGEIYWTVVKTILNGGFMRKFIDGLGDVMPSNKRPMEMPCDNEPALAIAEDPEILKGARNFQRKYQYIHEVIQRGEIVHKKVHTDDNIADPFTKPMSLNKHFEHAMLIGIVPANITMNKNEEKAVKSVRAVKPDTTDQSSCISWGHAQSGELGYGPHGQKSSAIPKKVEALEGMHVLRKSVFAADVQYDKASVVVAKFNELEKEDISIKPSNQSLVCTLKNNTDLLACKVEYYHQCGEYHKCFELTSISLSHLTIASAHVGECLAIAPNTEIRHSSKAAERWSNFDVIESMRSVFFGFESIPSTNAKSHKFCKFVKVADEEVLMINRVTIHGHYANVAVAAQLFGALNVPMLFTSHSLGRDKVELRMPIM
ncbi:hypothetical protein Tco_0121881 [Tanacetum coccineum]